MMTNFRQASSLGRPHERSASAVAAIRPRGERNGLHRCERLDATPLNESTINAIGLRISAVGDLRMARIVPSLAVAVIDRLFPHSSSLGRGSMYEEAAIPKLRAVIELVKEIPTELLSLRAEDYSALVISTASINATLEHWPESAYRQTFEIDELDPISLIRHVLAQCPDEFSLAEHCLAGLSHGYRTARKYPAGREHGSVRSVVGIEGGVVSGC